MLLVVMARRNLTVLSKSFTMLVVPYTDVCFTCRYWHMVSWGRHYTSISGCHFLRNHQFERHVSPDTSSDPKLLREKLWREFFSDPSQWSDHRSKKVNSKCTDFKHQKTEQEICTIDNPTPVWVKTELATRKCVSPDPVAGRKMMREKLWQEFFSDPSQWWDNRSEEVNPRYPDFKHKKTGKALWLVDRLTPPWVRAELAIMARGLVQSNLFSWNVRLRKHLGSEDYQKTLDLFKRMQQEGMMPDKFTFIAVLNACSRLRSLEQGRRIHGQIIKRGCESDMYVATCLVDMYAKCGSPGDAWSVFTKMQQRDVVSWSALIVGYVKTQQGLKALELFRKMQQEGVEPNTVTFVGALNACASIVALEEGRRVHEQIFLRGYESDVYVANCLVDMYAKCGCIDDAWSVFNKMQDRTVVSWTAMIGGYVKSDQGMKALELFQKMHQEGVEPNTFTFVGALNACASVAALEEGRLVHKQIIQRCWESDVYVATCLIDMYAKCGSIEEAWSVFKKIRTCNVVCWNAMIGGYVNCEQGAKALELFREMQQEGVVPDAVTFVGALSACAKIAALEEGMCVHEQIIKKGCESDVYVINCLVDMYAKCGSINNAWRVFNKMQERNVISWNAIIGGYLHCEQGLKALELFRKMQQENVEPNIVSFVGALNACASIAALEEGRCVHEQIIQRGCEFDVYVANCLVDMYAKCGSMEDAWSVFNKMREHTVVCWNAMIVGYVKSEQGLKALELFRKMQQEGMEPNTFTFVAALNACASLVALEEGRCVHKQIIEIGCQSDGYVANCLVHMYAKCGSIEDAWSVFNKMQERSVVSWTAMIVGYVKSEQGLKALELFQEMQQQGVEPNPVTFVGVLNACASVVALEEGKRIHEQIIWRGCESDVYVATCIVDMYAKCGSINDAWSVFDKMRERDVVSWSAMIVGYVKSEQGLKALELFRKMQQEGVEPDLVTFVGALKACASMAALQEGRCVHKQIIQRGWQSNVYVATCLVDMYAKCGSIKDARNVFSKMQERDVVSWSAMIGAHAMHGHSKKAIELFKRMGKEGVEIDEITFTCLLSACSHGGHVKEGLRYFKSMTAQDGLLPMKEHYACIVDLLGRAGHLEEAEEKAEEMMKSIALERDSCVWMTLLGACRIHGNIEMAERAAKWCWKLDPEEASAHVLLSNIYATAEKWDSGTAIEQETLK